MTYPGKVLLHTDLPQVGGDAQGPQGPAGALDLVFGSIVAQFK